jgi:hypothetical protein
MPNWDESKHPRSEDGRFAYSGGDKAGLGEKKIANALMSKGFADSELRKDGKPGAYHREIGTLDKLVAAHRAPRNLTLHSIGHADFDKGMKKGDTFTDHGYQTGGLNGKEIKSHVLSGYKAVEVRVPKGTHAVKDNTGGGSVYLERGSTLRYEGGDSSVAKFSVVKKKRG